MRDRVHKGERSVAHSLLFSVTLSSLQHLTECPGVVGWEKNAKEPCVNYLVLTILVAARGFLLVDVGKGCPPNARPSKSIDYKIFGTFSPGQFCEFQFGVAMFG